MWFSTDATAINYARVHSVLESLAVAFITMAGIPESTSDGYDFRIHIPFRKACNPAAQPGVTST
jgi:hypothetical protein